MMTTLCIANEKGGVGKTSIALHATYFAEKAKKSVCLVDLDQQGNATSTFLDREDLQKAGQARKANNLPPILMSRELFEPLSPNLQARVHRLRDNVYIIPADSRTAEIDRKPQANIENIQTNLRILGKYFDYIVIDTPPGLGNRTLGALGAADFLLAPITPARYALDGITSFLGTVKNVRSQFNRNLTLLGVLLNRVNTRSKRRKEAVEQIIASMGSIVLPTQLAEREAVETASDNNHPVWRFKNGQSATKAGKEMLDLMYLIFAKMEGSA